ncbi:MAG: CHC2 zinc finger domain-containing protein [Desulfobulbaceae bacterium]|nr:CHC2 zinc finger domain-containing protein [Desulfobulbaceae bacterium]
MTLFSSDDGKNRVREAADIVQVIGDVVELKKAGGSFMGRCPFHGEKTPSFSVQPHKQFFHCFGCGESGDVFSFMMKYHSMTFPEALKELAKRFGVELPEPELSERDKERIRRRELLYKANEAAAEIYHHYLLNDRGGRRPWLIWPSAAYPLGQLNHLAWAMRRRPMAIIGNFLPIF